jgi:CheY-like chemotaxis protein
MSSRILLVEDEPGLVLTLSDLLAAEGYEVESATDGRAGLARATAEPFDLVILDVMLPGKNGFEVCRELRQRGRDCAILMLTAKSQLTDRVVGLKLGADDYLTKPFEPPELVARIEALLRRVRREKLTPVMRFQFGNVEVDFEKATWWTIAARWFPARSCWRRCGNISPESRRGRSMCMWRGCGRSWRTLRRTRGTFTPSGAWGIGLRCRAV